MKVFQTFYHSLGYDGMYLSTVPRVSVRGLCCHLLYPLLVECPRVLRVDLCVGRRVRISFLICNASDDMSVLRFAPESEFCGVRRCGAGVRFDNNIYITIGPGIR